MKFFAPSEYQPRTSAVFEQLETILSSALPFAKIEHIGSSAIAGAVSKGDLDVFVGVPKNDFSKSLKILGALGFKIKEDTLRTESLCMLVITNYNFDVAIQLVELGSKFENFIEFRDRLNSDPHLVDEYNKFKKQSMELNPDQYRLKKSDFIAKVLGKF